MAEPDVAARLARLDWAALEVRLQERPFAPLGVIFHDAL